MSMSNAEFTKALEGCKQLAKWARAVTQLGDALDGLSGLDAVLRERQASFDALGTKAAELTATVDRLQAQRDLLEAEIRGLESRHADAVASLEADLADRRAAHATAITALEQRHSEAKAAHETFLQKVGAR